MTRLTFPIVLFLLLSALPVSASSTGNSEAALQRAIATQKPTLLQFGARWCPSCSVLRPIVEGASREKRYADRINFVYVDVDYNETLRATYRITSIPVIVILNGSGKEIGRRFGAVQRSELLKLLDKALTPP